MYRLKFLVAGLLFCSLGCGGSAIQRDPGTEGGPCHYDGTCFDDLVCNADDICVVPECTGSEIQPCSCSDGGSGGQACDAGLWADCVCLETCGNGTCESEESISSCPQDCLSDTCGDGVIDPLEACDGSDVGQASCSSVLGVPASGELACTAVCDLDASACEALELVTVQGVVWSPGADEAVTQEANRFPVPGTLVAAYGSAPTPPPTDLFCNECADNPPTEVHTYTDAVDGSFTLGLEAGRTYWLTLQKGAFWRTRELTVPDTPGDIYELDWSPGTPRRPEMTLPHATDAAAGDSVPSIAVVEGLYEEPETLFTTLGFGYGSEIDVFTDDGPGSDLIGPLLIDPTQLSNYGVMMVSSGISLEGRDASTVATMITHVRQWVMDGGTLFVDDFNYDFVEQAWPGFITWYSDDNNGVCGDGPTPPAIVGECNSWTSSYDFAGQAPEPDLAAWLQLPTVNGANSLMFERGWNYIHSIQAAEVGSDNNGPILQAPTLWIQNVDPVPFGAGPSPAYVSWPYYCGRVIYGLPITTTEDLQQPRLLTVQEKIFYYLLLGDTGC